MKIEYQFKKDNDLESRKKMSQNISKKYPDKMGIIVESHSKELKLTKNKFIVNRNTPFSYFFMTLKKFLEIKADEAVFIFVNNSLPNQNELMEVLYKNYSDEDGFLYCNVSKESTFG